MSSMIAVHGCWFDASEISLLAEAAHGLAYCPGSNMFLGDGVTDVVDLHKRGVRIGLGRERPEAVMRPVGLEADAAHRAQRQARRLAAAPGLVGIAVELDGIDRHLGPERGDQRGIGRGGRLRRRSSEQRSEDSGARDHQNTSPAPK